jgi:hypothetical protein
LAAAEVADGEEMLVPLASLGDRTQFTARIDPRVGACVGTPLRLRVDPGRMHFFDPTSGTAISPR